MSENTRRHNYLNLIVGLAFLSYGCYRLITFWNGAPYTTFRIIIAIGFIFMGGWDLYRFFNPSEEE